METSLSFLCLYYTIYLNNVNTNYKNNLNFIFAKALAIEFDSCYNYKCESAYPRLKDGRGLFFSALSRCTGSRPADSVTHFYYIYIIGSLGKQNSPPLSGRAVCGS